MLFLAVLVILGYAAYVLSPDERSTLLKKAVVVMREAKERAEEMRLEPDAFRDALRQRTPLVLVTPALMFLIVTVYVFMTLGSGSLSEPDTLIGWGANIGMRTTNGEWWRLVASMFLHVGFFQVLINIAGLMQVGILLERLLGHMTVAFVFFAAGILAGLQTLSVQSVDVSLGASGAI